MLWIIFAGAAALLDAAYYLLVKRYVGDTDAGGLAAGTFLTAGLLLLAIAAVRGIPPVGEGFLPAVALSAGVNTVAAALYLRAFRTTDISLAVPMLAFTPLFLVVTSSLMLREGPTAAGLAGIACIAFGVYVLNLSGEGTGILDPFRKIRSDPGIVAMLGVAFLFSIGANADKLALQNSDPVLGTGCILLAMGVLFAGMTRIRNARTGRAAPLPLGASLLTGSVLAASAVAVNLALAVQIVPYVIAMKRLSILITVIYAGRLLGEGDPAARISGAVLMATGAAIIALLSTTPD
ncbi:EamA family transporter [Methanoculleus taiwanensis]|uniref:EamA family transporter n=1 Tax=Methanoculleus taiwanensis TaxID=1550565 RepID=UPI000FFE42E8|nr:EamA family transporter [Methanoculleus taiwanensis]